ncbi:MAG: STAS domain-containing protein [Chlorobiaceae bacterium]|nr:STAS domain-containing protein [Chlorobiaceae bacterium]
MNISETQAGSITIVAITGTLDASTTKELLKSPAISNPAQSVVMDLEHLDFLDSSGLGALIGTLRKKRERSAETLISCMNDRVRRVFEITNAHRIFHIFDDTAAAVDYATQLTARI